MTTINDLAREFLAQKRLAVFGISGTRDVPGNQIYQLLKQREHEMYAINPHVDTFDGDPCYPNLAALPSVPDGVVIVTSPDITLEAVQQCVDAGVKRVWMHDMRGTNPKFAKESGDALTSVSPDAVALCREHGITVIPGGCPRQFDGDFGHKCMRWMLQVMGAYEVEHA
jgi:predicted CoA-binding protein